MSSPEWCDDGLNKFAAPLRRIVLNCKVWGKGQSPHVKLEIRDLKGGSGEFIIDTGAELNLIKRQKIGTGIKINNQIQYHLFGISEQGIKTLGEIHLEINGKPCPFQIVPDFIKLESDGIFGMLSCRKQSLTFQINALNTNWVAFLFL